MFGRRNAARTQREAEVGTLLRRGRTAARVGNHAGAAHAQESAAEVIRALAGPEPDPRDDEALGGVLYDLGESLAASGRPEEAVVALDEAEEAYGRLSGPRFPAADRIADVQARRGTAYGMAGAGGSALVDAQSAVVHYRRAVGEDPQDPRQRDLARVLAGNADVLAAYGDPDLAVASADLAVRLYLHQAAEINASPDAGVHVAQLRRALSVAVAVHGGHGRRDLADQAATIGRRMGGLVPTVLADRQGSVHPPALAVTVASALDTARRLFDIEPPRVNDRPVVRPAVAVELVVPLDRVLRALGPGAAAADAAARLGGTLAAIAAALLPADPTGGVRLGLEAHALLAGASRLESPALRYQLPALGPPWAAALLACSRYAEATRDPALAMDLAAWAGGVAEQLFPATLVDRDARTVAVAVLDHHGRLLAARGEDERARDAALAAARLLAGRPGPERSRLRWRRSPRR